MEEQENISFSYMGKYDQPQEISFITSQKIEEYRNKVLENEIKDISQSLHRRHSENFKAETFCIRQKRGKRNGKKIY